MFAVGAVALVTYALHGLNGILTRDLAVYSYAGQQVADGVPPYMGILNRAGPLAHVIPAVGVGIARLGGFDDVTTMRVLFMLIATVCTCMVYLLGRDVFRSRPAGLVTAATFLTFYGFIHYAANGPREKTPMTLFIVCALWAVSTQTMVRGRVCSSAWPPCACRSRSSARSRRSWPGVLLLAAGRRIRALVRVALGGAVPVAVFGMWFVLAGSLRESIDAFVLINWTYTVPNPVTEDLDGRLARPGDGVRRDPVAAGRRPGRTCVCDPWRSCGRRRGTTTRPSTCSPPSRSGPPPVSPGT